MSDDIFDLSSNISEDIIDGVELITPHDIAINEYKKFTDCFDGNNQYVLIEFYDPNCSPCLEYDAIFVEAMNAIKDNDDIQSCQINLRDIEVDNISYQKILTYIPNHDEIIYPNTILYYHNEVQDTLKGLVSFDEVMKWLNGYIQSKVVC